MPTFLHAADLHLDSPLRGLDRKVGAPAGRIREASRIAFARMVDTAIARQVAFVLLAGDIYDSQPAFETFLFFRKHMERLSKAGIPVAIVLGNHDHGGVSPRAERLPEGVHVLPADKPDSLEIVPGVWVHGQSYPTRDIGDDLTENYPTAVPDALNIGLLHTALDGHSGEHARYAPSSTQRLAAHGYAYWALGHVHAQLFLQENGCHIVYPGNLQGRHARETGPKGAVFVEYDGDRIADVGFQAFDNVRWYRLDVDVAGLDQDKDLLRQVGDRVLSETQACRQASRLAAVRIRLGGTAPASLVLLGEEEIRESLRANLASQEDLFLEKIELDLQLASQDEEEVDQHLKKLIDPMASAPDTERELESLRKDLVDVLRKAGGPELEEAFRNQRKGESGWTTLPGQVAAEIAAVLPLVRQAMLFSEKGGR